MDILFKAKSLAGEWVEGYYVKETHMSRLESPAKEMNTHYIFTGKFDFMEIDGGWEKEEIDFKTLGQYIGR